MGRLQLVLLILLISISVHAQNPEWINYYGRSPEVFTVAVDGNYIWAGGERGLMRVNTLNDERIFYDKLNSGLPNNFVRSLSVDASGNKWIGTDEGLVKYDGTSWTIFTTSNSGLPSDKVLSLAIDSSDNIWIGTYKGGLAKFDGFNWTIYTTSNSNLPDDRIYALAIDSDGTKWIGTYSSGLAKFDGITGLLLIHRIPF